MNFDTRFFSYLIVILQRKLITIEEQIDSKLLFIKFSFFKYLYVTNFMREIYSL